MNQSTPPSAALRKLPIGRTTREAWHRVFGSLGLLFKAAALPFALSMTLLLVSFAVGPSGWIAWPLMMLGFLPYTLFGVAWHRYTLLGPARGAFPLVPVWHRRHWRFLGYLITVALILYGAWIAIMFLGAGLLGIGTPDAPKATAILAAAIGLLVALPYLTMRLSFVFPAAAVDETYGLGHAWAHTRGQGFRLLAAFVLSALPVLVVLALTGMLLGELFLSDSSPAAGSGADLVEITPEDLAARLREPGLTLVILIQITAAVVNYVLMALMVSVTSIAFRVCTGWVPDNSGPPAPTKDRAGEEQ